jgi:ribosome-binding protein aMBF1 (putative translation factor)
MGKTETNWDELRQEFLSDPDFARLYREASDRWDIGLAVGRQREALGMSEEALAQASGLAPSTIRRVEAGDCDRLSTGALRRVLDALGLELHMSAEPAAAAAGTRRSSPSRARTQRKGPKVAAGVVG